ncbi:invasion associated locus B family protein [Phyllobacterium sp. YR531]|uniref:invasion associated locus B family protein n=1 Tax=Phyllobacterium sp. YR531 TaxID=1144343 RepID=UPI00026F5BA1|nr:invasion associated locus B family protein [Phyllobacterium sp. YR531]EJN02511.1 Invasion protein B, involved in pathogenesis [Phyllobacterium sp. YR531]
MAYANLTKRAFSALVTITILGYSVAYSSEGFAQDATPPEVTEPAAAQAPASTETATPQLPAVAETTQPLQQVEAPIEASAPTAPDIRTTKFDDWYYRCVDTKESDGKVVAACEVAQISQVKQNDQDVNVLTLAIAKTAPDPVVKGKEQKPELLLTVLVPLNVFLPVGFGITVSDKPVMQVAYRNCNQAGCWAQQKLDAKMLTALQKGAEATGSLRLLNGQNINIKFSLKGLSAALSELQKPAGN